MSVKWLAVLVATILLVLVNVVDSIAEDKWLVVMHNVTTGETVVTDERGNRAQTISLTEKRELTLRNRGITACAIVDLTLKNPHICSCWQEYGESKCVCEPH